MLLQRYIFWNLVRNFLLMLVVVTALALLIGMAASIGRFKNLGFSQILDRVPYLLPTQMWIILPLSLLIATLLTYGRLSAANEIQAVRLAGIHPVHAVMPAIVLGLVLVGVSVYINGSVAPRARVKARQVTKDDLRRFLDNMEQQRLSRFMSRGVVMSWKEADEDGWLRGFFFRVRLDDEAVVRGEAERAKVSLDEGEENLLFTFEDVTILSGDFEERLTAPRSSLAYPVADLFSGGKRSTRKGHLTSEELRYRIYRDPALGLRGESRSLAKYRAEYWRRQSLALACLVFVLAGAPVGILFRRGSFVGSAFVALLIAFVIYYPLMQVSKSLVYHQGASAFPAMFLPTAVVGLIGLVLLGIVFSK